EVERLQALPDAGHAERHGLRSPLRAGQPQRANNVRLAGLLLVVDQTEPVLIAEGDDQLGQVLVGNPAAQLAIEGINRRRAERVAVNLVNRLEQLRRLEQRALEPVGVALQPLVAAEARAGRPSELPAD